jgi:hypothetical protein
MSVCYCEEVVAVYYYLVRSECVFELNIAIYSHSEFVRIELYVAAFLLTVIRFLHWLDA